MGTFLSIGLAKTIFIRKNNTDETFDEMREGLSKNFDLSLYEEITLDKYFVLDLKSEIFEKEIINLLKEISDNASEYDKDNIHENMNKMQGKRYEEVKEMASNGEISFSCVKGSRVSNDISYLLDNHEGFADIMSIICDGKIIMECYSDIFYFMRNIIVNALKSKLRKCVVISIIG